MKKTLTGILKIVLPLGLGIFLIWFIYKDLSEEDKNNIIRSFKKADYRWILLSFFIGALSHLSRAHRWLILLEPMGYRPRFINSFFAVMTGYLANMAFPRLGEVSRCGVMTKYEKIPFEKLFGTVLAERVIDMVILSLFTIFTFVSQWGILNDFISAHIYLPLKEKFEGNTGTGGKVLLLFLLLILFIVVLYALKKKALGLFLKVKAFINGLAEGFKTVLRIRQKALFLFHTLFIWSMYFMMFYVCFFSLPETKDIAMGAVFASFVMGSFGIIAVQGGIGAYQALVSATLALYGITLSTGFAFGWIAWAGQTLMILVLGLLSIILLPQVNKKYETHETP